MLIPEDIGDYIAYDAETGLLTWIVSVGKGVKAGDRVGCIGSRGYIKLGFRGITLSGHRVAWFLGHGEQPPERIDHGDLNRTNNRLANLRAATPTQNNANCPPRRKGRKGVALHACGRFQAQIKCHGKNHYLGLFATEDEAAAAYAAKAEELFGEFARVAA